MEYMGVWCLNKEDIYSEEKCVPGTLFIEDKNITLNLNGSFEELTDFGKITEYRQIFGFTKNGHFILLLRNYTKNHSFSAPGYNTQILGCQTCFDFQNIDCYNQNIKKITFELNALNNYFFNDTFCFTPSKDGKSFSFDCKESTTQISFEIDENEFNLSRIWYTNENNKDNNLFTCKSKLIVSLRNIDISNAKLESFYFDTYLNYVRKISRFFMLLTNRYLAVKHTNIYSDTNKIGQVFDIRDRYNLDDDISMYQKLNLTFDDTTKAIKSYFKKLNKYKNIVGLFSEHMYESKQEKILRTKSSFINICGILEDYYRNIKNIERTAENDIFDETLNSIKSRLDKDDCLWLDKTLRFNNQISFRVILIKFFDDINLLSNNKIYEIISKRKRKSLITKIFNTRNWFTHYGDKTNILDDDTLVSVIDLLWIFLRYLILNDFDVNKEQLTTTIKNDSHISYLIREIVNN